MSSHLCPFPRRSMIIASSAALHLDCFFAGDVGEFGGRGLFDPGEGGGGGSESLSPG